MGRMIVTAGIILLVLGLTIQYAPWLVNWFGKLPGDIRIDHERTKVYVPITSMILISLALTLLINLFRKL